MNIAISFNLKSTKKLLKKISDDTFIRPASSLSDISIGQHVRHILEFYFSIVNGIDNKIVNYDARKRSLEMETNKSHCIQKINELLEIFESEIQPYEVTIKYNESEVEDNFSSMASTSQRELMYCLDHSIHHQALIKVALKEFKLEYIIDKNFGLAYSTIRNRNKCAQ